jgi:hypothetical protein
MSKLKEQTIKVLDQYKVVNPQLSDKITSECQLEALKVILKNQQKAEEALDFTAKCFGLDTYQFNALELGMHAFDAMKIDTDHKLNAVKILKQHKHNLADAPNFTAKTYGYPIFEYEALKLSAPVSVAMQIKEYHQLKALELVVKNKHNPAEAIAFTAEKSLGFSDYAYKALSLGLHTNDALQIKTSSQIDAISALKESNRNPAEAVNFTAKSTGCLNFEFQALKKGLPIGDAMKVDSQVRLDCVKDNIYNYKHCLGEIYAPYGFDEF